MAKPESILGQVKGMARDFSMDSLPKGYVWDLCDYIPQQRGAQLEARAPWAYLTQTALAGTIWSGFDAVFAKAEKLLVHAGGNLYEQPRTTSMSAQANANLIGSLFGSTLHSGRYYLDKVYWADGAGVAVPKSVAWNGSVFTIASLSGANTPKATLLDVFKNRLVSDGGPTVPNAIYWAPADPSTAWDNKAFVGGFPRAITALGAMPQVLIVFHDGLTSRIKGGDHPPATGLASDKVDITRDVLSAQYGCVDPASVVPWQENLVWACSHGIMTTQGPNGVTDTIIRKGTKPAPGAKGALTTLQLNRIVSDWYTGKTGLVPVVDPKGKQLYDPKTGVPIFKSAPGQQKVDYQQALKKLLALKVPPQQALAVLDASFKRGERGRPALSVMERAALTQAKLQPAAHHFNAGEWDRIRMHARTLFPAGTAITRAFLSQAQVAALQKAGFPLPAGKWLPAGVRGTAFSNNQLSQQPVYVIYQAF